MIDRPKHINVAYLLIMGITLLVASCDSTKVYESYIDYEGAFWHQDSIAIFTFQIDDASKEYNLLAHFRNSQAYPYHNMYYRYSLKDDNDSVLQEDLTQIFLFDPKTGQPQGSGVGDLFDNTQPLLENYTFPEAGTYKAELSQYMRMDSLKFILSVGWRVETVEE